MSPRPNGESLLKSPWWGVVVVVFAVGGWAARSEHRANATERIVAGKVDTTDLRELRRDVREVRDRVDSLALRQQQYFCANKASFCR